MFSVSVSTVWLLTACHGSQIAGASWVRSEQVIQDTGAAGFPRLESQLADAGARTLLTASPSPVLGV